MGKKINITESERNRIKKLYGVNNSDYVFDFVLTENHKYLIIMDELFVKGGNGKSIGSIWDNTHIFNDLIKENFTKLGIITEQIENNLNSLLENIKWNRNEISNWLKEKENLTEQEEDGLWNSIKSGGKAILSGAGQIGKAIFKQGLLPALQWVRRALYTGVGIVVDVVASFLLVKSNAIVWMLVVILDIYEIITGNFDEKDPIRKESPYFLLIADLVGALLTGAAAFPLKAMAKSFAKYGIKGLTPNAVKTMQIVGKKIPQAKSSIKNVTNLLSSKFGTKSKSVLNTILNGIDKVLDNVYRFTQKLFSKEGAKATAVGVGALGVVKGVEHITNKSTSNKSLSDIIKFDPNADYTAEDYYN